MLLQENSIIRDIKIIKKIGEGGMGCVYLGEDRMLERNVALKVLNPLLTIDHSFTERFRQEAKLQASLIHPNIITLYNFFIEGDNYCMVMEYAGGFTLKKLISKTGPIPETRALHILKQILEGAEFAHSNKIIHRDIKPSNIIVDSKDNVKIMDFGIAKILERERFITTTGAVAGTTLYMSPEQVKAEKELDNRTDIYSIGITLFQMLTGKIPYGENIDSEFLLMKEIVDSPLPDPREIYPFISNQIIEVLKRMTNKDKNQRYSSCTEILNEIEKINREVKESVLEEEIEQAMNSMNETSLSSQNINKLSGKESSSAIKVATSNHQFSTPNDSALKNNSKRINTSKIVFLVFIVIALSCAFIYFISINKSPQKKIESEILDGNYAQASELIRDNELKLGRSTADEYKTLVRGCQLMDSSKFLEANSYIADFPESIIRNKDLIEKIHNQKTVLSGKLRNIESKIHTFLDSYSYTLKLNNISSHVNLFMDRCYSFDKTIILSKNQLYNLKSKFFNGFTTLSHRFKLLSFGTDEDGYTQVIAEEYHETRNNNDKMERIEGVKKRFHLKDDGDSYRIFGEENIETFLKMNESMVIYKNYRFNIIKSSEDLKELEIVYPNGSKKTEDSFSSGEFFVKDYDNDGEYEVLLSTYSGGAHCCTAIQIFNINEFELKKSEPLNLGDSDFIFTDIDGNGTSEFSAYNASYAYQFTSFAASIFPPLVYEYRNGKFEESTAKYPELVKKDLKENSERLNKILSEHDHQLDCSESSIEAFNDGTVEWMSEYRSTLAAAVTDNMLLYGKQKAFEYFDSNYRCNNTSNAMWTKISSLASSYSLPKDQDASY